MIKLLFFMLLTNAFATEGYPPESVNISYEQGKRAFISNKSCSAVTVFVNGKDFFVPAKSEEKLESDSWTPWSWKQGKIGSMDELTLMAPLTDKTLPNYGPGYGETHVGEYFYSYDFNASEGTDVFAMEGGTVIRLVQHYTVAHQDKSRMGEVNVLKILHNDGSFAEYLHLQPQSVKVKLCDKVLKGQLIAKTGHNGFSKGPHLHVHVGRPLSQGKFKTIPLNFKSR